jgi:hypothetical protein
MGTKKHNTIVIALSAIIAVSIVFIQWRSKYTSPYKSRIYTVTNGWGYDILVKDTLFIHQESIPAIEGNKPFGRRTQAMEAASRIISKLKKGESPSFSQSEIEQIRLSE